MESIEEREERTQAVRHAALKIGFDLVGMSSAAPFQREQALILDSLSQGRLDGMAWITEERVRLSCDPEALLPGARSIVALGTAYGGEPAAVPGDLTTGHVARYAWGRDYHDTVPPRLRSLSAEIECIAPGAKSRCFVDTGPLVDRAAAERSGIGFIGKNTCVLSGRFGSFVILSAVLTTASLTPDSLKPRDCGNCRACIDACPTEALVAPRTIDATRCISYLTIEHRGFIRRDLRDHMGSWVFGCDVCQDVCPWNRARQPSSHSEFQPDQGSGSTIDLIQLLALSESEFRSRFRGTPLTRPKRRGLLRNAAVALGNSHDARAIPALIRAMEDDEPSVRGHAAWALTQMPALSDHERQALRSRFEIEQDEQVRDEIRAALGMFDGHEGQTAVNCQTAADCASD